MSRFVRLPSDRWLERLVRAEADALDVGIMGCLVAVAQQQGGVGHRQVVARLGDLHSRLNLPSGERAFSDRLKKLRRLGELDYATTQGQRRPLEITIVPDDYFGATYAHPRRFPDRPNPDIEGYAAGDFEETSYAPVDETPGDATRLPLTSSEHRSRRTGLTTDQSKVEERNRDHGGGGTLGDAWGVAEAIEASLASAALERDLLAVATRRTGADRLLALLPEHHRTTSVCTGVRRRVECLSPRAVDRVDSEFRTQLARGDIRKPAAYLYALLKKELRHAA